MERIYLSPPHMGDNELEYLLDAYKSNWIAPIGPYLQRFEEALCQVTGTTNAVALSSGTAGIHLALQTLGIKSGDTVVCSDLTFIGSIGPAVHMGAVPVFVDSDEKTWNMDPHLLQECLETLIAKGQKPKAVIVVHLYGQCTDMDPIVELCRRYEVPIIEDAAEALGATYKGRAAGSLGDIGVVSFNGNKIITTSGGGAVVTNNKKWADQIRFLSTQAKEPVPHYEHKEVGFNYRMSNLLAAIGLGQLEVLQARIASRQQVSDWYKEKFASAAGLAFMPVPSFSQPNFWLSCLTMDKEKISVSPIQVIEQLQKQNIEARPLWMPMHMQPVFKSNQVFERGVGRALFASGLCLPSGSRLQKTEVEQISQIILRALH